MQVLVINAGSSSLKYQLIDMANESVLAKGLCDRIGIDNSFIKHTKANSDSVVLEKDMHNHKVAISEVLKVLTDPKVGVLKDVSEISAVGHRVAHGGEKLKMSQKIINGVLKDIEDCIELAPLHNPANIVGIEACKQAMPNTPMVAVFDTAFHQTIPDYAYLYALPYELYEKYSVRKYGFHGTSHKYVAQRAAEMLNKPLEDIKVITCHLGNGASICAIDKGESIDTTMGFTPLDGVAMGTRSGSIDPGIFKFLMEKEKITIQEMDTYLNKKSGMLGLSGVSSDFRDLHTAAEEGNKRADIAVKVFCYAVKKYIGSYLTVLNGADAIVFTAGVGENDPEVRKMITDGMENLGIKVDSVKNDAKGEELDISASDSRVKVFVIPTNEELVIARETAEIVQK